MDDVVEIVFLRMEFLFPEISVVLVLAWLTWLITYLFGQKRDLETTRIAANQQANFDAAVLPLRLQAVERLILLLERIRPDGLVHRSSTDQPAATMQLQLLAQLRAEFEHNLAQQAYVTPTTWALVIQARDQVAGAIQQAGALVPVDAPGILFARQLLQQQQTASQSIDAAVVALRRELHGYRHA